ncbi:Uncharacterised protein [Mycobacteroides abscessus subsp. massiliense]|nr:Uncharacterised protein [Mycobacteroides abscessus]SHS71580.1 Uncharacterised protein [Mycobacteroides abscessus subsp. abscessus]SKL53921.1 Uncharacterised protein [Mycobacteroides abscessus subsp. massiliense]CPW13094.1 Uncharacterised protein [Mycobacteroides abscessus]CPZ23426.1 Uncharacterised protein [Mycobacteroides abscessus]
MSRLREDHQTQTYVVMLTAAPYENGMSPQIPARSILRTAGQ